MRLKAAQVLNARVPASPWLTPETVCLNLLGFKFLESPVLVLGVILFGLSPWNTVVQCLPAALPFVDFMLLADGMRVVSALLFRLWRVKLSCVE